MKPLWSSSLKRRIREETLPEGSSAVAKEIASGIGSRGSALASLNHFSNWVIGSGERSLRESEDSSYWYVLGAKMIGVSAGEDIVLSCLTFLSLFLLWGL